MQLRKQSERCKSRMTKPSIIDHCCLKRANTKWPTLYFFFFFFTFLLLFSYSPSSCTFLSFILFLSFFSLLPIKVKIRSPSLSNAGWVRPPWHLGINFGRSARLPSVVPQPASSTRSLPSLSARFASPSTYYFYS